MVASDTLVHLGCYTQSHGGAEREQGFHVKICNDLKNGGFAVKKNSPVFLITQIIFYGRSLDLFPVSHLVPNLTWKANTHQP